MRSLKVLAVLMGAVMGVVTGLAASGSQGSTAIFSVPTLIRLTVDTATINFGTLTMDDYDLGYKELLGAQIVTVWSNRDWSLNVAANSATWTGPWDKPSTDLLLAVGGVNKPERVETIIKGYFGLKVEDEMIAAGYPGGNIAFTMNFRVLLDWDNDVAGDYSLGFTYTLTAP